LTACFSDAARQADDDCDHVAERRQGDEEVEATHGATVAEDMLEEEGGGGEFGVGEFFLGDWGVLVSLLKKMVSNKLTSGEEGDVGEHVEDVHGCQSGCCIDLE
jgi:hypothetical protein